MQGHLKYWRWNEEIQWTIEPANDIFSLRSLLRHWRGSLRPSFYNHELLCFETQQGAVGARPL